MYFTHIVILIWKDKMKTRYDVLYAKCVWHISAEKMSVSTDKSSIRMYCMQQNNEIIKKIEIDNTSEHPSLSIYYDVIIIKCTKIDNKISEEEITFFKEGDVRRIPILEIYKKYKYKKCITSEITAGNEKLNYEGVDDLINAETYEDIVSEYKSVEKHTLTLEYGRLKKGK